MATLERQEGTDGVEGGVVQATGRSLASAGIEQEPGFGERRLGPTLILRGQLSLARRHSRTDSFRNSS